MQLLTHSLIHTWSEECICKTELQLKIIKVLFDSESIPAPVFMMAVCCGTHSSEWRLLK